MASRHAIRYISKANRDDCKPSHKRRIIIVRTRSRYWRKKRFTKTTASAIRSRKRIVNNGTVNGHPRVSLSLGNCNLVGSSQGRCALDGSNDFLSSNHRRNFIEPANIICKPEPKAYSRINNLHIRGGTDGEARRKFKESLSCFGTGAPKRNSQAQNRAQQERWYGELSRAEERAQAVRSRQVSPARPLTVGTLNKLKTSLSSSVLNLHGRPEDPVEILGRSSSVSSTNRRPSSRALQKLKQRVSSNPLRAEGEPEVTGEAERGSTSASSTSRPSSGVLQKLKQRVSTSLLGLESAHEVLAENDGRSTLDSTTSRPSSALFQKLKQKVSTNILRSESTPREPNAAEDTSTPASSISRPSSGVFDKLKRKVSTNLLRPESRTEGEGVPEEAPDPASVIWRELSDSYGKLKQKASGDLLKRESQSGEQSGAEAVEPVSPSSGEPIGSLSRLKQAFSSSRLEVGRQPFEPTLQSSSYDEQVEGPAPTFVETAAGSHVKFLKPQYRELPEINPRRAEVISWPNQSSSRTPHRAISARRRSGGVFTDRKSSPLWQNQTVEESSEEAVPEGAPSPIVNYQEAIPVEARQDEDLPFSPSSSPTDQPALHDPNGSRKRSSSDDKVVCRDFAYTQSHTSPHSQSPRRSASTSATDRRPYSFEGQEPEPEGLVGVAR